MIDPVIIDSGPSPRAFNPREMVSTALDTWALSETEAIAIVRDFFSRTIIPVGVCRLPLSQGFWALVDAADFERLSMWKWSLLRGGQSGKLYVHRLDDDKRSILLHREVIGVTDPKILVDHENSNGLDCRRGNLRAATRTQNSMNRGRQANNTSGYKGVSRAGSKWGAYLKIDGRTRQIGRFDTPEAAAYAYDEAAAKHHGEFARLNFPRGVR